MRVKLRMSRDEVLEATTRSVELARAARRRRGVERRGRQPERSRLPVPLRRGGDPRRRDHDQHPGHRRLRHARGHGAHLRGPARARAGDRGRGPFRPQPQRPRHGRRQHHRGDPRRRPAGGDHHQRHRRARRQRQPRRGGDGLPHPPRRAALPHQHRDAEHPADQPAARHHHRLRRAAEQGDRRPQRLRARVGHPPGRRAQGRVHLRDHDAGERRLDQELARPRQALGPRGLPRQAEGAGLRRSATTS